MLVAVLGAAALADGKVFRASQVSGRVTMPDQSALILFDGEIEQLFIETAFQGEGREFAWLVPLPAVPEVSAASPDLFPMLRKVTGPEVVRDRAWFVWIGLASLLVAAFLWWAATFNRWPARKDVPSLVLVALLVVVFSGLLLPGLSGSPGREAVGSLERAGDVTIHGRARVGVYDTVTLGGESGDAVHNWLSENGFHVPESVTPVLDDYTRDGWTFVAGKLSRNVDKSGTSRTHPLRFRFPSDRAIYPLKLTGVGNDAMTLDLYCITEGGVKAPPLGRACAAAFALGDYNVTTGRVMLDQPDLIASWPWSPTKEGKLTLLTGELPPDEMGEDLVVASAPFAVHRTIRYTDLSAFQIAAAVAALVLLVGVVPVSIWARRKRKRHPVIPPDDRVAATMGMACGVLLCGVALLFLIMTAHRIVTSYSLTYTLIGLPLLLAWAAVPILLGAYFIHEGRNARRRTQGVAGRVSVAGGSLKLLRLVLYLALAAGAVVFVALPRYQAVETRPISRKPASAGGLIEGRAGPVAVRDAAARPAVRGGEKDVQAF